MSEGNPQKCIDKEWLGGENNSAEIACMQTPFSEEEIIVWVDYILGICLLNPNVCRVSSN